ncbi:MAG: hypothetical protein PHC86_05185 [Eubacteriales bacterium]|nr:hypothetical protein [Eubacteriales bacterium]
MKNVRLSLALVLIALLVAGIGSAALSVISLDRSVEAGVVRSDVDADVAVQFAALGSYGDNGFVSVDATTGEIAFDLKKAVSNSANGGWNTDAHFVVGSAANGVFEVANNSDVAVKVSLTGATGGLTLKDSSGAAAGSSVIEAGSADSFYFDIATAGVNKATAIGGTLAVRNA